MTKILFIAFFIASLIFSKRYSDLVKNNPYQKTTIFDTEALYFKRYLIVSGIALLVVLVFPKKLFLLSQITCLIYAFYIAYKLYIESEEIIGQNEQYAVRLYTSGKLIAIYTILSFIGNLC